jgi:hypothetical protein
MTSSCFLSLLVGVSVIGRLAADRITLHPVADTTLLAVNPGFNLGAEEQLTVGGVNHTPPNGRARMLVRFDLPKLPVGSVITNVILQVSVLKKNDDAPPETVGLHRVLRSWNEGVKTGRTGQLATAGEATWLDRAKGSAQWAAPGGLAGTDFTSAASTRQALNGVGRYTFPSSPALIAEVQTWRSDPTSNYGWMLVSENEDQEASARRIASRERTGDSPVLILEYSAPQPEPQIVLFNSVQLEDGAVALRFHAEAGNIYSVWYRPTLGEFPWLTLTNVVSKLVSFDAVVTDAATARSRYYQLAITGQVD